MREYFLWLAKLCTILAILIFVIPALVMMFGAIEDGSKLSTSGKKKMVAVVEVTGAIMESKEVLEKLYKQIENPEVKGIVLRVDSPGGAVGPAQEIYSAVKQLKSRKPIVASMGAVAASGGLYVALGASKIFCQPGTLTGSIGVIMQLPNFTEVTRKIGVDMITIKSGELKDAGNSFRAMTDDERKYFESTISRAHSDFIDAVAAGRSLERDKVLEFADGRVLLGSDAKNLKLVDEYGDIYDAARAVFEILGEPLKENELPKLYYPKDRFQGVWDIVEMGSILKRQLSTAVRFEYMVN